MNKLEQAMEDHKQGKWQQADTVYKEIIEEEPENAEVMYLLAISKMSQNSLDEAITIIEKAIEINPKAPAFYQTKGSILARKGFYDEALIALKRALKDNPNLYQSHIVSGHIYYTKGNTKEAQRHFKLAKKIDPKQPEAQVNLAKVQIDNGEIEAAINSLREIEKQHPDQASVKMMLGQAFIEKGAYSFAENYFQKVLAMHPEYDLAGLYLGIAKLHAGDNKSAGKLIHSFNQQHQNSKEGLAALGLMAYHNKQFRTAVEYLRKAMSAGLSPISWRGAFVESLAHLGEFQPAIDFYEKMENKFSSKTSKFRLGELYELQGKIAKAKKQYKKVEPTESKYIAALLGQTRCYLAEEKAEKAETTCQKVLSRNAQHAEATLLLLTSLLFQNKQPEALKILDMINYENYNDVYKKTFRLQHGLILDKQEKHSEAMAVFNDDSKKEHKEIPKYQKLSEQDVKKIQKFETNIDDEKKDPIFIVGVQSTAINNFVSWLHKQGVVVLNDRLISLGRMDILYALQEIETLNNVDADMAILERKIYHQKAKVLMNGIEEETLFADCMSINPCQIAIIKKFFPGATVVLLSRETNDIWLSQQVFGKEPIDSSQWDQVKNQIISMDLNLLQIDMDKWLENDKQTLNVLSKVFEKELKQHQEENTKYWRKSFFAKGHWKKYQDFLSS